MLPREARSFHIGQAVWSPKSFPGSSHQASSFLLRPCIEGPSKILTYKESFPRLWILPHGQSVCQNCPVANESACSKKGHWSVFMRFLRRFPILDDAKVYAMNWPTRLS